MSGKLQGLNPSPVIAGRKDFTNQSETVNSHVNSCVANVHFVTGLPQKKGVNPFYCQNYAEIKYVKDVSRVGHLISVNCVTNVPTVALDLPVGARLHQFWKRWATLALADLNRDPSNTVRSGEPGPAVHVPHTSATEKVHLGGLHMRAMQWHLKNNWRVPESLEKVIPVSRSLHFHLKWWLEESNVLQGQPLHPLKHALEIFTDTSKEGWDTRLKERLQR